MKLISLNIEGKKHFDKVLPFLDKENPDVICLQEAPIEISSLLQGKGYKVSFLPITIMSDDVSNFPQGNIFASRLDYTLDFYYYHRSFDDITQFDPQRMGKTVSRVLLLAELKDTCIATTHFTWAPDGSIYTADQIDNIHKMFDFLDTKPPHVLCGDMNIPRKINKLYEKEISPRYIDAVPDHYKSSLDKNLHRVGDNPEKEHLFKDFMVDYLLLKEPIKAKNVRLEFGLSDHAAIVSEIYTD